MKSILLLITTLVILSCTQTVDQNGIKTIEKQLAAALEEIDRLNNDSPSEGKLVHMVFFKLKEGTDEAALTREIHTLASIDGLMDLQTGPFQDLGDERALAEHNWIIEMSFDDVEAYEHYQVHPTHLALKKKLKSWMANPPSTYDYLKK